MEKPHWERLKKLVKTMKFGEIKVKIAESLPVRAEVDQSIRLSVDLTKD